MAQSSFDPASDGGPGADDAGGVAWRRLPGQSHRLHVMVSSSCEAGIDDPIERSSVEARMEEIVLGIGTSRSPLLNSPAED